MNPFTTLSLPTLYNLSQHDIQQAYIRKQQETHPDRFTKAGSEQRQQAMQQSMDVNQAYQQLKDPLKRAQALLALHHIDVNTEHDTVKPSQLLLIEVMELREVVDDAANAAALESFLQSLEALLQQAYTQLNAHFEQEHWTKAADCTIRLQYLTKIVSQAHIKTKTLS